MAHHKHKSLPYRPALDGLRGVAVAAVLLYHVKPDWAPGGWLGVDLFFVLSGFLITSLLLHEHDRWGNIDLIGFWISRARRLLPTLVVVLLSVLVAAAIWTEPGRKQSVGWDIFSSLFYFANWRFLLGDEQYFSAIALPSPVRHTWSLSIEEQYYMLFPLLMIALAAFARSRAAKAAVLMALALVSAWWMTHNYVPDTDPSRVYYGTDTRAFELLIGASAGCLLSRHQFRRGAQWSVDKVIGWGAWPAVAIFAIGFFTLPEHSALPFQGGLFVLSLLAVLPIAAASSREHNAFQVVFSFEPLRRLGLISYALYLWHWPVIIFVNPSLVGLRGTPLAILQVALSILFAYLTYQFVEKPIRKNGIAALIPRQPRPSLVLAGVAVPLVIVGTFALPQITTSVASPAGDSAAADGTEVPQPDYKPLPEVQRAMLVGNSVPASIVSALDQSQFPDLQISNSVNFGCDPFDGQKVLDGQTQPMTQECLDWRGDWGNQVKANRPGVVLFFVPQTLVSDFKVDGKLNTFGSEGHDAFQRGALDEVRKTIEANGSTMAISTLACHDLPDLGLGSEAKQINDIKRVQRVNGIARAWAAKNDVGVIDTYNLLCAKGFSSTINGVRLYKDGLHFSTESGRIYWNWLAPELQKLAKK